MIKWQATVRRIAAFAVCVTAMSVLGNDAASARSRNTAKALRPVDLRPDDARFSSYTGEGVHYAITLQNDNLDRDVTIFPEPPLVLRRVNSGRSCSIDGGVWVRGDIYFARNESRLITHEYSGSSDEIIIYRTSDCKALSRVNLPERAWSVADQAITIGIACQTGGLKSCRRRQIIRFR